MYLINNQAGKYKSKLLSKGPNYSKHSNSAMLDFGFA